jgi:hypothetical protein
MARATHVPEGGDSRRQAPGLTGGGLDSHLRLHEVHIT